MEGRNADGIIKGEDFHWHRTGLQVGGKLRPGRSAKAEEIKNGNGEVTMDDIYNDWYGTYVELGDNGGLLHDYTELTVECWFTSNAFMQWARIFGFGNENWKKGIGYNYLVLSPHMSRLSDPPLVAASWYPISPDRTT